MHTTYVTYFIQQKSGKCKFWQQLGWLIWKLRLIGGWVIDIQYRILRVSQTTIKRTLRKIEIRQLYNCVLQQTLTEIHKSFHILQLNWRIAEIIRWLDYWNSLSYSPSSESLDAFRRAFLKPTRDALKAAVRLNFKEIRFCNLNFFCRFLYASRNRCLQISNVTRIR